jgi:hypothetical protein
MRSKTQWLEMIARTRPSAFAVNALETQLQREAESFDASELQDVRRALADLQSRVIDETPQHPSSARALMNVDDRPEGMGGKGRIYAEVEGRKLRDLLEHPPLDDAQVYVFLENDRLAGVQVDNANSLSERFETVFEELERLNLERVDLPEAGLEAVTVGEVLRWIVNSRLKP